MSQFRRKSVPDLQTYSYKILGFGWAVTFLWRFFSAADYPASNLCGDDSFVASKRFACLPRPHRESALISVRKHAPIKKIIPVTLCRDSRLSSCPRSAGMVPVNAFPATNQNSPPNPDNDSGNNYPNLNDSNTAPCSTISRTLPYNFFGAPGRRFTMAPAESRFTRIGVMLPPPPPHTHVDPQMGRNQAGNRGKYRKKLQNERIVPSHGPRSGQGSILRRPGAAGKKNFVFFLHFGDFCPPPPPPLTLPAWAAFERDPSLAQARVPRNPVESDRKWPSLYEKLHKLGSLPGSQLVRVYSRAILQEDRYRFEALCLEDTA